MTAIANRPPPETTAASLRLMTGCPSVGVACVAVTGEVDMATAAALHAALLDVLATYHPTVLDVDLSGCTFLDCSGLRVLVAVHTRATADGCLVSARNLQPLVELVFQATGLLDLLTTPAETTTTALMTRTCCRDTHL